DDPARNLWFVRDHIGMARANGWGEVAPFYIELETPTGTSAVPRAGRLKVSLRNDHLQYAITWFGLAVVLVFVFGFWVRSRFPGCRLRVGRRTQNAKHSSSHNHHSHWNLRCPPFEQRSTPVRGSKCFDRGSLLRGHDLVELRDHFLRRFAHLRYQTAHGVAVDRAQVLAHPGDLIDKGRIARHGHESVLEGLGAVGRQVWWRDHWQGHE